MHALKYILTILAIVGCGVATVFLAGYLQTPAEPVTRVTILPTVPAASRETTAFETLLVAPPSPALTEVIEMTYANSYKQYSCTTDDTNEVALMLAGRYDGDLVGSGYETIERDMRAWENQILADLGHVLFPGVDTSNYKQIIVFEDVPFSDPESYGEDVRRARVLFGVEERYVYYGWLLNYVIITTSESCLKEVMRGVYHVH